MRLRCRVCYCKPVWKMGHHACAVSNQRSRSSMSSGRCCFVGCLFAIPEGGYNCSTNDGSKIWMEAELGWAWSPLNRADVSIGECYPFWKEIDGFFANVVFMAFCIIHLWIVRVLSWKRRIALFFCAHLCKSSWLFLKGTILKLFWKKI